MKKALLFITVFYSVFSQSQIFIGKVFKEDGEIFPFADIYLNSRLKTESSKFGLFQLQIKEHDTISIIQPGFGKESFIVPAVGGSDTIHYSFFLKMKISELTEVFVSSSGISKIIGRKNEHILDFYPIRAEDFFVLKEHNKDYFISYESGEKIFNEKLLDFKPQELFRDFLGNVHILSQDSSYQIYFEDSIQLMHGVPLHLFETQLKPIVALGNNELYLNRFGAHNQRYFLDCKARGSDLINLLMIRDSVSEYVASLEYSLLIGLYHFSVSEEENIILHGVWNGDVNQLMNRVTKQQLIWYSKIRSLPLNVQSFDHLQNVITVDLNSNQVYTLEKSTHQIQIKDIAFPPSKKGHLVYDYLSQQIYFYLEDDGKNNIYLLNVENGVMKQLGKIEGVAFPKKLKIVNGIVYFICSENQFGKVYRMNLKTDD